MNEPLISVIVPIYKVEKYLTKCIDSIIVQSYKNLEIILVNDGSPDNCSQICDEYEKKDMRIKVIHKENGGLSSARNAGLDIANGEYIGFVDSDDSIHEDMYKVLYNNLVENNADISQCSIVLDDSEHTIEKQKTTIYSGVNFFKATVEHKLSMTVWNNLYKAKIWSETRFLDGYYYEDVLAFPKIDAFNPKVVKTNLQLYRYNRQDTGILRMKKNMLHLRSKEKIFEVMLGYLKGKEEFKQLADFYACQNIPAYRSIIQKNENITKEQAKKHNTKMHTIFKQHFTNAKKCELYKQEPLKKRIIWNIYNVSPSLSIFLMNFIRKSF